MAMSAVEGVTDMPFQRADVWKLPVPNVDGPLGGLAGTSMP